MSTFVNIKDLPFLIEKRSKLIGLPDSITRPAINDFRRWCSCNGTAYAVDRMKVIKQIVINYVANGSEIPKDLWIRKQNKHLLSGHFGELQKLANQSARMLRKVLTFLNLYTVAVDPNTSEKMMRKFRDTVTAPLPAFPLQEKFEKLITQATRSAVTKYQLNTADVEYAGSYELVAEQKPHQEAEFLHQVERLFRTQVGRELIQDPVVFMPLLNCLGFRGHRYDDLPPYMGRIFRIPSPGLKDRWVCDFNKPLDHCLKPMGKRIYDAVASVPWDITFDESKCYENIQNHLRLGRTAYAFDLSSATDRFPWWVQHTVLKAFSSGRKYQEMVALYDRVIRLPAEMPDGSSVQWEVGQPLGAYPSFATFSFSHGILLYALNGMKYNGEFFVHGDDVVILDDNLAVTYKGIIQKLGVPISEFKSVVSNKLTEINSKVITSDSILTVPKWKPITRKNALSQIKNWGVQVLDFLRISKEEKEATLRIASLPVCLGGAGVNPAGIPLSERLLGLEDILFKEKKLSYQASSRSQVFKRYLANPNFINLLGNALRSAHRADQARVQQIPENMKVFDDERDLDILGANLYSVNPDLKVAVNSPTPKQTARDQVSELSEKLKKSNVW